LRTDQNIGSRLLSALPFVTENGVVADIGTDHAYLPIALIEGGLCRAAVACDINFGPIESARRNIEVRGLSDRIATLQTDGLHGVEAYAPTDVLIFGMGGELIVRILSEAPWLTEKGVNLILQPMSRGELLRRWLLENGFAILNEALTYEDQYYQTIHARYCGNLEKYTEEELYLGRHILNGTSPLLEGYLKRRLSVLRRIVEGKQKGAVNASEEEALIAAITQRLKRLKREER